MPARPVSPSSHAFLKKRLRTRRPRADDRRVLSRILATLVCAIVVALPQSVGATPRTHKIFAGAPGGQNASQYGARRGAPRAAAAAAPVRDALLPPAGKVFTGVAMGDSLGDFIAHVGRRPAVWEQFVSWRHN